ncbi:MAG: exodeoxyribonuclease VII large subunit [Epsilonproteobacteria bacterium]|nr:exodeoxyribonuclease VII large subunit [Campylobacterota bacterium]
MQEPISVTELNNQIKTLLETTFFNVYVEGELSRITYHASGHIYFTLKDENSSISCVMFRGNKRKLKFRLQEGMKVFIKGSITVYSPRGNYQINCLDIEPSGEGALALAFKQLKEKLQAKGYFDQARKKALPKFVDKIVIVTSKTGAAIQDMLRVAKKRWPLVEIVLIDTLVQGEAAALDIARNIKIADSLGADVIIVGRGGGSVEDLWAFNEEVVADAIFEAKTPIVSAVGHEIDFLISDFTADLRAPTPSAAMEMILPDINEVRIYFDTLFENYESVMRKILDKKAQTLLHLYNLYEQNNIISKIELFEKEIESLRERFSSYLEFVLDRKSKDVSELTNSINSAMEAVFSLKENDLLSLKRSYENNDPSKRGKKGFAQIVKEGSIVSLSDLKERDLIELQDPFTVVKAEVLGKKKLN